VTRLPLSLRDWGTPTFAATLKVELEQLPADSLPLQRAVAHGGIADDSAVTVTVFGQRADGDCLHAHVGVFFTEIIINCGCGDDPQPVNAYCEMDVQIARRDGSAMFHLRAT